MRFVSLKQAPRESRMAVQWRITICRTSSSLLTPDLSSQWEKRASVAEGVNVPLSAPWGRREPGSGGAGAALSGIGALI
jgi:hypothetical protein